LPGAKAAVLEAQGKRSLRADVLLQPEDLQPVAIEVKFAPGAGVEQDAIERIEKQCARNGRTIRTAFAVLAPASAKTWRNRGEAAAKLAKGARLQYCAFIRRPKGSPGPPERWPETGFIPCTAATLAEAAAAIATPGHEIKMLAEAAAAAIRAKANRAAANGQTGRNKWNCRRHRPGFPPARHGNRLLHLAERSAVAKQNCR